MVNFAMESFFFFFFFGVCMRDLLCSFNMGCFANPISKYFALSMEVKRRPGRCQILEVPYREGTAAELHWNLPNDPFSPKSHIAWERTWALNTVLLLFQHDDQTAPNGLLGCSLADFQAQSHHEKSKRIIIILLCQQLARTLSLSLIRGCSIKIQEGCCFSFVNYKWRYAVTCWPTAFFFFPFPINPSGRCQVLVSSAVHVM